MDQRGHRLAYLVSIGLQDWDLWIQDVLPKTICTPFQINWIIRHRWDQQPGVHWKSVAGRSVGVPSKFPLSDHKEPQLGPWAKSLSSVLCLYPHTRVTWSRLPQNNCENVGFRNGRPDSLAHSCASVFPTICSLKRERAEGRKERAVPSAAGALLRSNGVKQLKGTNHRQAVFVLRIHGFVEGQWFLKCCTFLATGQSVKIKYAVQENKREACVSPPW